MMSTELTKQQKAILAYICENNDSHCWVPVEPDAFDGQSLPDLEKDCRDLESEGLLEVDYPASALYAIRNGERVPIEDRNNWLLCAITVEGIQALEAE